MDGVVTYPLIGKGAVAVLTHFFKVVITEDESGRSTREAYALPNEGSTSDVPLDDYRVAVERVEVLAGVVLKL